MMQRWQGSTCARELAAIVGGGGVGFGSSDGTNLQADEHDYVALALLGLKRALARVEHGHELVEHGALDKLALVRAARELVHVDDFLDVFAQAHYELHIDVGLDKRVAYFLEDDVERGLVDPVVREGE